MTHSALNEINSASIREACLYHISKYGAPTNSQIWIGDANTNRNVYENNLTDTCSSNVYLDFLGRGEILGG